LPEGEVNAQTTHILADGATILPPKHAGKVDGVNANASGEVF
jgi:hypothetical protein